MANDFYEEQYGRIVSDDRTAKVALMTKDAVAMRETSPVELLEIGCGNADPLAHVLEFLKSRLGLTDDQIKVTGWDVSETGIEEARKSGFDAAVHDITDRGLLDGVDKEYDVILFTEVLEHVVDTGQALRNIHGLLKEGGFLVMTTPNLASWYNRILLLFGIQPHMTEVSFEPHRFGNRLFEKVLGEKSGESHMAGHVRVFCYRALREFLEFNQFKIVRAVGIAHHGDLLSRSVAKIWKGGAGDIGILAQRV